MPRIHTITTDTVLSDNDMLLGTDGAVGANNATKNFSFGVFKNYITSNVTFTGDTIISGGNLTLDNNKFLMSKMANGTAASLIGISSNNQIKLSNSNLPIYTGTGLTSLGGNLELPNGNIIANGTLAASGYNDSNWNAAYVYSQVGHLPLTGGTITGNMINRGEQSFGVDGDGELFKIYTNTSGKLLTFNPASNGKLNFTDNTAAMFGNSDDLQIYHNGTANYIDSNGGHMFLRASVSDGKMYFMGDDGNGGHTEYFYLDGAAAVYDSNQGQAVSVETRFPMDSKATFGITGSMQTSLWNSNSGNFYMSETGGGNMYFQTDGAEIVFQKRGSGATHQNPLTGAETMAKFIIDGAVELYHNNNKKLETTSFGIQTTGSLNIHGAYQFPISDGANGQVLKTNGSGTLAFANDAGALLGIQEGGEFTNSLIVGHTGTGTLDDAKGNTAIGVGAFNAVTSGDHNAALGHDSLTALTTGSSNVALGKNTLKALVTGSSNVAVGKDALIAATGDNNTSVGFNTGSSTVAGIGNVFIGHDTGKTNESGNDNVIIGSESDVAAATSGTIIIGHDIVTSFSNTTIIGQDTCMKAVVKALRKEIRTVSQFGGSSTTLTQGDSNKHIQFRSTNAHTITLPDTLDTATNLNASGVNYEFISTTNPTSGNIHKVVCHDTTNCKFIGGVMILNTDTGVTTYRAALNGDNYSAFSFNGSTTGGRGSKVNIVVFQNDEWHISGTIIVTGTTGNPFTTS